MAFTIVERISGSLTSGRDALKPIESQFGRLLPDDYADFLRTYNGGRPKPSVFTFKPRDGKATESRVQCFFGCCDDADYGLLHVISTYRDRICDEFCPIACDAFGNLLLLSLRKHDHGSVWFWDHERESPDTPTMDNMEIVAASFIEFIENLR